MSELILNSAGVVEQGRVRRLNQDSFLINRRLNFFGVADGVESGPYGEVASRMALEELEKIIGEMRLDEDVTPAFEGSPQVPLAVRALKYAIREVNRRLYQYGEDNPKFKGMGTTLSSVWFYGMRAYVGHIGDSRVYLVRKKLAQPLTQDHTSLSEPKPNKVEDIEIYEGMTHSSEHELTRAVGINPDVQVQLAGGGASPGDRFVLCTDGLYGGVRDWEIAKLALEHPPQLACRKLIQLANQRGGEDNIAVVVIQVEE